MDTGNRFVVDSLLYMHEASRIWDTNDLGSGKDFSGEGSLDLSTAL